jgi:hypothetical protein
VYRDAIRTLPLLEEEEEELDSLTLVLLLLLPTLVDPMEEEIRPRGGRDLFGSGNRTLLAAAVAAALAVVAA